MQITGWMNAALASHPSNPATKCIIAPHAGYAYSGPCAAYAYSSLPSPDTLSRIFILGPSHHFYSDKCHMTLCTELATPLGPLPVDRDTVVTLQDAHPDLFAPMGIDDDEAEHSIEMHLPYVKAFLSSETRSPSPAASPAAGPITARIIPIVVGALSPARERAVGAALAPHLADPRTVFVISSDFCHWGRRFGFQFHDASRFDHIHESIAWLDSQGMKAIEAKRASGFVDYLAETSNTICGRHPIGVLLCALETAYGKDVGGVDNRGHGGNTSDVPTATNLDTYEVEFTRYERSGLVEDMRDSSVSYASAVVRVIM